MTRLLETSIALFLLSACLLEADCLAYQKRVPTRSVTGTYKYGLNRLEVLELPGHKVRISFADCWPNDRKRRETRNVGSFDETVPLTGNTAIVKIKYGDDPCIVTLEFRSNRVIVAQEGSILECGFGFNVEADGTYVKLTSKPPKFPPR